jgi:STE24 endopeptidase
MPRLIICALIALLMGAPAALAQDNMPPRAAPTHAVSVGTLATLDTTPAFDAAAATRAYLARVSGAERARSDAYFEGGYWLMLLDLAYALVVAGILLGFRLSAGLRDWLADRMRDRLSQTLLYTIAYVVIVTLADLPLAFYETYIREHAYGLSNQNVWQWLGDFGIGAAVTLVTAVIGVPLLYAAIRRARETWWLWGAGLAILLLVIQMIVYPLAIAPLTNHYQPLADGPVKRQILSLARANDIPATQVYVFDASRQSSRISANVAGFMGTTRIALTDNLMRQPADEVLAVMGHEMGHYVMGHALRMILLFGLVIVLGFGFAAFGFRAAADFFGGFWDVRRVDDIAGLPLLAALAALYLFVMTPLTNTIVRSAEHQADIFGLNAVRQPDAFARVMLKLSSYRKLEPGAWEEAVFYDHPSGRTRIEDAMRWKKEHIADPDIRDMTGPGMGGR